MKSSKRIPSLDQAKINTEAKRCFATHDEDNDYFNMRIYIILIACVYIQQFNFIQKRPYGTVVNTYAAQSGGCRFESLWGFGFSLKGAYYEVGYCGKKTFLAGLQCTLTSSCAKTTKIGLFWCFTPIKAF